LTANAEKETAMLKKIVIALAVVVLLVIAVAAVLVFTTPTDFAVEREITINRPRDEVFAYVRKLKTQNEWGPWFKRDPAMKQEYRGTDGEVGFVGYWKGTTEESGEGEQEIMRIVEGERIDTELRFKEPFESKADAHLITEAVTADQTRVKWGFTGTMPRPLNLFLLIWDMDSVAGKDFEEGLASLKTILENKGDMQ
jgi:uncharacterized protein YndB with AHSA1/START domain